MVHSKSIKYQAYVTGNNAKWLSRNKYIKFDTIYRYIVLGYKQSTGNRY